jgi:hypothetical protein
MTSQTIVASYNKVDPMAYIAGDINLRPEYLKLVGTAAFREQCGDYLVIGEQKGRWFYGTVQLTVSDTTTASVLSQKGDLDASYATASVNVAEDEERVR